MAESPSIDGRLDQLSRLNPDDRAAVRPLSAEIRRTIERIAIPDSLAAAITRGATPGRARGVRHRMLPLAWPSGSILVKPASDGTIG
jgi:hypothetical protein